MPKPDIYDDIAAEARKVRKADESLNYVQAFQKAVTSVISELQGQIAQARAMLADLEGTDIPTTVDSE